MAEIKTELKEYDGEIARLIIYSLKKSMEEKYEELKKDLIEKLDLEKDTIISGIALHLTKQMNIKTFGEVVQIEIKTEPIQKTC